MALIEDRALVLDSFPYGDRHLILALLTPTVGVLRGVLRGARGGRNPRTAATQILSLLRVVAHQGPHAELATIRQVSLEVSSFPLAQNLESSSVAAAVAELLATFCPQGDPAPRRFRLGAAALQALLDGLAPATILAYCQTWLLTLSGLLPPLEESELAAGDLEFLLACRVAAPSELTAGPSAQLVRWLDDRVRLEADRPLRALDFLRSVAT